MIHNWDRHLNSKCVSVFEKYNILWLFILVDITVRLKIIWEHILTNPAFSKYALTIFNVLFIFNIILHNAFDDAFSTEYALHCNLQQRRRSWLQSWTCIYCHYVNCTYIAAPDLWMVRHRLLRRINTVIVCNHSSHMRTFRTTSPVISKRQSDYVSTSNCCDRWAG